RNPGGAKIVGARCIDGRLIGQGKEVEYCRCYWINLVLRNKVVGELRAYGSAIGDRGGRAIIDLDLTAGSVEGLREITLPLRERGHRQREGGAGAQALAFVGD